MTCAIFVPGHSVVKMTDGSFQPSGLYQDIVYLDPPKSFPFRRTGIFNPNCDPDAATSYLGGGEIVVRGAASLYRQLESAGKPVTLFMVGGRSDYLIGVAKDQIELSEASVMERMAYDLLGNEASIRTIDHTRTTEDDVRSILENIEILQVTQAFVVMMAFRLSRAETILQRLIIDHPEMETAASRIVFTSAETYVPQMTGYHRMWSSAAYARTAENERIGVRKILSGQVATTGGKT